MKERVSIKNSNGHWNIIKENGTISGSSKSLPVAIQDCTNNNLIISNMSNIIDSLTRADIILNWGL